jgi:tRNA-specific 2-thiouridylase
MTSKPPNPISDRLRVAVGMSGGLDSSVAAALLVQQGHEVVGFTAHLWAEGSRCCSLDDAMRARHVAQYLGFEHYVIDAVDFFGERIVNAFVEEYVRGRTPSPCVLCNQVIKFGLLLRDALQFGCTHIATGHYARVEQRDGRFHLRRGVDESKDQSYFLHRLDQAQLSRVLFPLGQWTKEQAREFAHELNLPVSFREESQDLCFIKPDAGYAGFLEQRRPQLKRRGEIRDTQGRKLGEHEGFYRFTIGQREGIGVASGERLYVKEVHPETNVVVVGRREEVAVSGCRVEDVLWTAGSPAPDGTSCLVQLRYRHRGARGALNIKDSGEVVEVFFEEPQFAVTPGQAAVFYDGDEVLGGGWIAAPLAAAAG